MAIRMQQRTGTYDQWNTSNPVLNGAEIGYESDTNKFKIGDGSTNWNDLPYFLNEDVISTSLDGYIPESLLGVANGVAQLNSSGKLVSDQIPNVDEITQDAINTALVAGTGLDKTYDDNANTITLDIDSTVATKTFAAELLTNATKSNIAITGDQNGLTITAENGIADSTTSDLAEGTNLYFTDERAQDAVGNNVGSGLAYTDSTGAIGINYVTLGDTLLDGVSGASYGFIGTSEYLNVKNTNGYNKEIELDIAAVESKLNTDGYLTTSSTSTLTNKTLTSPKINEDVAVTATATELNILDGATLSTTELNYVDGVTSSIQSQIDSKAPIISPTFTGTVTSTNNLVVDGDFTVNGTNFAASATSITIEDNMLQLAHQNVANTVDLGIVVGYNDGTVKHSGIVRDVSDDKWKLFKGVTTEPATTVDFTQGSLDNLQVAGLEASSATIGDVSNTELQHLNGVTSAVQTQIDSKAPIESPTFTGTVSGVTKTHVGLANVDNTSDANKPVSTATQTALDAKIAKSDISAKGAILVGTGSGTYTAQTVGSNGQVLTANSAQADGVEWTTISGYSAPTLGTTSIASGATVSTIAGLTLTAPVINVAFNVQQGPEYTLVLSDNGKIIDYDGQAAPPIITVPTDSSVAFPVGAQITVVQSSNLQVTFTGAAGVTVNGTPGLKLRNQWSSATLIKRATNTWLLIGDLSS